MAFCGSYSVAWAADVTAKLAGQIDARQRRQAVKRGVLVQVVVARLIETGSQLVKEVVARVVQAFLYSSDLRAATSG